MKRMIKMGSIAVKEEAIKGVGVSIFETLKTMKNNNENLFVAPEGLSEVTGLLLWD